MFKSWMRRISSWHVTLWVTLALLGGIGLVFVPAQVASTSSSSQFGVQHAEAKPKKKKKKKKHKAKKPAKPKPKPNVPVACASIATRTITNIPRAAHGTSAQQFSFTEQVKCVVDATPRGQTVWITIYSYEIPSVVDALIKAHRRGVNIRVTSWGERAGFPQTRRLMATLGRNPRARSYAIACVGSCLAGGIRPPISLLVTDQQKSAAARALGIQHAKGIAVSMAYGRVRGRTVPVRFISFVGSANFSYGNTSGSWNTTQQIVGDPRIYAGLASYISATRWDRPHAKFPTARSVNGVYELHFYPGNPKDDPVLNALKNAVCKYGPNKRYRTQIRISAYKWTLAMDRYRRELKKLRKKGCVIGVVTVTHKRDGQKAVSVAPLRSAITPRLVKAGVVVYDSTRDVNRDGYIDLQTHDKSITVRGRIKGQASPYLSVVGGRNWTEGGMSRNSELMLVSRTKQTSDALWVSWYRQARLSYRVPCYSQTLVYTAATYKALKKRYKKGGLNRRERQVMAPYKRAYDRLKKLKHGGKCEQTRGAVQRVR